MGSALPSRRSLRYSGCGAVARTDASGGPAAIEAVDRSEVAERTADEPDDGVGPERASSPSSWRVLPDAPLQSRAHAVTAWTGVEAIFWGGRTEMDSADGGGVGVQAHVGGAAYDPVSDAWRPIEAPQWGHPGAEGVYHDGWLYVQAKGGVTRFNPATGSETDIATDGLKGGWIEAVFVAWGDVWVVSVLNRGPGRRETRSDERTAHRRDPLPG